MSGQVSDAEPEAETRAGGVPVGEHPPSPPLPVRIQGGTRPSLDTAGSGRFPQAEDSGPSATIHSLSFPTNST